MFAQRCRSFLIASSKSQFILGTNSKAIIFLSKIKMTSTVDIEKDLSALKVAAPENVTVETPTEAIKAPKPAAPKKVKNEEYILKTAKGTRDFNPTQMAVRDTVFKKIIECFQVHGAVTIDTPVFERKEILTQKYGDDAKLIYDLADQQGELLALRYDLTVPFARYLAMNKITNIKRYQIGKVYRRDNPCVARGRFREFYQCDFDISGIYDKMLPDSECVKLIVEILEKMDLGDFQVKINHRKLLDGMFEVCGVPQDKIRAASACVDKLDKTEWAEVRTELINEKHISPEAADKIGVYTKFNGGLEMIATLKNDEHLKANKDASAALEDLELLFKYCEIFKISDKIVLDLSLARGLDYYTGVIYEAVMKGPLIDYMIEEQKAALLKEAAAKAPAKKRHPDSKKGAAADAEDKEKEEENAVGGVGSVAGGGRYDNLVNMFDKKSNVPCIGFSIGVERLFAVMEAKLKRDNQKIRTSSTQIYIVTPQKGFVLERLKLIQELWAAGIKAEHSYKENPKVLNQLQYCEENGIPYSLIIGESEITGGTVQFKTTDTRVEETIPRDKLIETLKQKLAA